jgi:hypothetical protein
MSSEATRAARHFVTIARRYGVPEPECWTRIIEIAMDPDVPARTRFDALELVLSVADPAPGQCIEQQWLANRRKADSRSHRGRGALR